MNRKIIFIFLIAFNFFGCKKGPFGNSGKTVIFERKAAPFNKISLFNNIDLILTQDTVESIKVEAGENVQPSIITDIQQNTLTIKNASNSLVNQPNEVVKVYVSVKLLQYLNYQGAGSVTCTNTIQTEYINIISNTGAGNVYLKLNAGWTIAGIYDDDADFIFSGQTNGCDLYCSSRGTMDLRDFKTKELKLDYSGVRNAYVYVTDTLKGTIYYKGNVYYRGAPALKVQTTNEGRFIGY